MDHIDLLSEKSSDWKLFKSFWVLPSFLWTTKHNVLTVEDHFAEIDLSSLSEPLASFRDGGWLSGSCKADFQTAP